MLTFLTSWGFVFGVVVGAVLGALFTRKNADGVNAALYVIRFTWRNFANFARTMKKKKTDGNL